MARDIIEEKNVTFPVLLDSGGFAREHLFVTGTPTTFIIDDQGRIRSRFMGGMEDFEQVVEGIVKKL